MPGASSHAEIYVESNGEQLLVAGSTGSVHVAAAVPDEAAVDDLTAFEAALEALVAEHFTGGEDEY